MASSSVSYAPRRSGPDDDLSSVRISMQATPHHFLLPLHHPSGGSVSLGSRRYSGFLPVLFDRASKNWWNPRFDSNILEEQYHKSTFPQLCQRFQYSLCYIILASLLYCIYCASMTRPYWIPSIIASLFVAGYSLGTLLFTFTHHYHSHYLKVSLLTMFVLCALSLSTFATVSHHKVNNSDIHIFSVGVFSLCILVLVIIYTLIPMVLYVTVIVCLLYSIIFEVLSACLIPNTSILLIAVKFILQLCIHIVGIHIRLMTEVRMRNTFFKVGQSLIVRRDLEVEKQLKEKMIHSVMPPKVAEWLMATQDGEEDSFSTPPGERKTSSSPRQSQMVFRPFNMHRIENVSILFADIVGFTKMSSNKTAEQLVGLLNDLFGRFDYLCAKLGCEKISTLGDCYYCVSGCPEPRPDHAKCCVEMGLGMIKAIGDFDEDTNESVNMRVGVHTGTVLCGIVGTKRFKFDVWSNDVSYANKMESTGKPGRVHISETTHDFLVDLYFMEEGPGEQNRKTYFIKGRKSAAYEKLTHTAPSRHSWPHAGGITEIHRHEDSRKTSCQSETAHGVDEDPTVPMLPVHRHSSLSTLNSSRKDSGIRSRRSSMQDTLLDTPAALFTHRTSEYASSQMSIADTGRSSGSSMRGYSIFVNPLSLKESLAWQRNLRKQSDLQMIRFIQQDTCATDYFIRPPVNPVTLFFLDKAVEKNYRNRLHHRDLAPTLASASFTTYFDIFVALAFYLVVMFSCFMLFDAPITWLLFCLFATSVHLCIFMLCIREILATRGHWVADCLAQIYRWCTEWYPWHIVGLVLVSLPVASVFSNFTCAGVMASPERTNAFCYLVFVCLIHFCNFTQLNFWLKSILSTCAGVVLALLIGIPVCKCPLERTANHTWTRKFVEQTIPLQPSFHRDSYSCNQSVIYEIILHVILNTILVWFLNREFEISYRLSFHGSSISARDQQKIQVMKNQADWLLHNIIPRHVAEQLKNTSKYSENHRDAGIIFASIVNFHDMYDEGYEGGKEYLRVLNELVGDFDELLSKPQFRNVTKIKTIGSTFMAASGLNPKLRQENPHPFTHLFELMDFALAMQQVIETFNCNLLEFNFIIRIGYCFGDITAGVIGTTKLYYDIWGDAVNIASRMDSHGVPGRIQVPEHCVRVLQDLYVFEPRGSMFIKGKDNMNVYLLVKKKDKVLYRILPSTPRASTASEDDKKSIPESTPSPSQ